MCRCAATSSWCARRRGAGLPAFSNVARAATGYHPDYHWLDVPVLDPHGQVRHTGGIVSGTPPVYVLGGNLLRTRRSSYIAGADEDTFPLANDLQAYLDTRATLHNLI